MENDAASSKRGRFMGKLFGAKERKAQDPNSAASLDAFLRSSTDRLEVAHPLPPPPPPTTTPKLAKLDTTINRYPQALAVNQHAQQNRPLAPGSHDLVKTPSRARRPNKKGFFVRFSDAYPDIIGEGGDESEIPVIEVSRRKTNRSSAQPQARKPIPSPDRRGTGSSERLAMGAKDDDFQPKAFTRIPTGFSSISASDPKQERSRRQPESSSEPDQPERRATVRHLDTTGQQENRKSFIDVQQAQMREAEGAAFAQASRVSSAATEHDWDEDDRIVPDAATVSPVSVRQSTVSPEGQNRRPPADYSPAASITSMSSGTYSPSRKPNSIYGHHNGSWQQEPVSATGTISSARLHDTVGASADDALSAFTTRTRHLFELFRLHAETVKPLSSCSAKNCSRASLWWFVTGRMGLEKAVRERPNSAQAQKQNELDRQQAYSNLAKGYWLSEEVIPEILESHAQPLDTEIVDAAQSLLSGLRKLTVSMERNGFLPPEEAFLSHSIDMAIWIDYPPLSQDMVALLTGNWASGMTAMQHPMSTLRLLDAFPVADSPENFSYGRIAADVYVMEKGREAQRLHFHCLLSMVRPQTQTGLVFVIASQDGSVQLAVQENKNAGPVWDDVRWRTDTCTLDVRLPRGFVLLVQLPQQDFRMLWSMYEFGSKVKSTLQPKGDETVVFRNISRSFQYLDADPQSRAFPKEPVSQCDVALFEKTYKENGPAGVRCWHCGFRIAVVTGPSTRTLSGISHNFPPTYPVQFGFFRSDSDAPALSLKYENERQKGRVVLVFSDEAERVHFHSLLTGTAVDHNEGVVADVPMKSLTISQSIREPTGIAPFNRMPWKAVRIVNEEIVPEGEHPPTVLADKLRVVFEYQNGTVTDRVNVSPGELRVRLEVSNAKLIRLLRLAQQDITMSAAEAQVPTELPRNLSDALQLLQNNQTIRTVEFESLQDLHTFQAALTGFEVLFDALASTFAISRRRMVVSIHKKWEAGFTRIQVVRHGGKQLQLLAFFEDFHHGHCMNFVLKGTDTYELFGKGAKSGVKFVDAKFPLPRMPAEKDGDYDDMAFVCLDLPDLPGEHDDISVVFEKEADRDKLCQLLPSPVRGGMKLASRLK